MKIHELFVPFEDELQLLPSKRVPDPPRIEWKSAFGDLFFRVKEAEPKMLWCDLGYIVTPKRPLPPARRATLAKRVSRAFNGRTFYRVVPFEDGDDWLLARPRCAVVKSLRQESGALWWWNASFDIKTTQAEWLSQPQDQLNDWLNEFKNDLPLHMARHCATLDDEARQWKQQGINNAAQSLWQQLARAVLMLATPPAISPLVWLLLPTNSVPGTFTFRCLAQIPTNGQRQHLRSEPAELLIQLLQRHIALPFWRGLTPQGELQRSSFPRYSFDSISHHERLEAALLWRDFAREIGKEAEVEALLRKLMG